MPSPGPRVVASTAASTVALTAGPVVAMDTSGKVGSVAVGLFGADSGDAGRVRLDVRGQATLPAEEEHASRLIPLVHDLLEEEGIGRKELGGIVVGAGPGSFTGVRVAAATAKGLARALHLPLWAFSSLAGAAAGSGGDSLHPRMVLFDARGDRVYAAAYRIIHGSMETLLPPRAATVSQVLEELLPPGAILSGDGAFRHRDLLEGAGVPVHPPPAGQPSAEGLLRVLAFHPEAPPLGNPGRWEPEYLRESGAERMWKRQKG